MVGDQIVDALDAVVEVDGGEEAVGRRSGDVVDPDAAARVVDLAEQKAAGLDVGATETGASSDLCSHAGEGWVADANLVTAGGVTRDGIVRPSEPVGPRSRRVLGVGEPNDAGDHRFGRGGGAVACQGSESCVEKVAG